MKPRTKRGVTLIEMLIVIAIISITAGSMVAFITAPAEESAFAEIETVWESGAAMLFSQLVADAHDATELIPGENPARLVFRGAGRKGGAVAYYVTEGGILRRAELTRAEANAAAGEWPEPPVFLTSAVLLDNVVELSAVRTLAGQAPPYDAAGSLAGQAPPYDAARMEKNELWRVHLRAAASRHQRDLALDRSVEIVVGPGWMGGGK